VSGWSRRIRHFGAPVSLRIREVGMQTYIGLANWTNLGIREIKNSPQRLESAKAIAKQFDGDILHFYMTMGEYDMVVISEFPDDAAVAKFILHLAKGGAIRTKTMKAFTETNYREIMSGLG
jgi:uncharacterized protein with GYD domain